MPHAFLLTRLPQWLFPGHLPENTNSRNLHEENHNRDRELAAVHEEKLNLELESGARQNAFRSQSEERAIEVTTERARQADSTAKTAQRHQEELEERDSMLATVSPPFICLCYLSARLWNPSSVPLAPIYVSLSPTHMSLAPLYMSLSQLMLQSPLCVSCVPGHSPTAPIVCSYSLCTQVSEEKERLVRLNAAQQQELQESFRLHEESLQLHERSLLEDEAADKERYPNWTHRASSALGLSNIVWCMLWCCRRILRS